MITLEDTEKGALHISVSPFDLIRLQVHLAHAMTHLEEHIRDNPDLSPARKNFWQGELTSVERDYSTLQRILDEYNEGL